MAVEQPHGEVGQHPAIDDQVTSTGPRVLVHHWLEEHGNRHAHAHRVGDLHLVGLDAQVARVVGQHEHPAMRDVGRDDPQAVAVLGVFSLLVGELAEPRDALGGEMPGDPLLERSPLVDAELEDHARGVTDGRHLVEPRFVLELGEGQVQQEPVELGGAVPRGHERRGDRAGRRPGHALRLEAALLEHGVRTCEADALDAPALEHEIGELRSVHHELSPPGSVDRSARPGREATFAHAAGDVNPAGPERSAGARSPRLPRAGMVAA